MQRPARGKHAHQTFNPDGRASQPRRACMPATQHVHRRRNPPHATQTCSTWYSHASGAGKWHNTQPTTSCCCMHHASDRRERAEVVPQRVRLQMLGHACAVSYCSCARAHTRRALQARGSNHSHAHINAITRTPPALTQFARFTPAARTPPLAPCRCAAPLPPLLPQPRAGSHPHTWPV